MSDQPKLHAWGRIRYELRGEEAALRSWNISRDEITLPSIVLSGNADLLSLTRVGKEAFYQTMSRSIDLPDTVTAIGPRAFAMSKALRRVSIPASVRVIDRSAFSGSDNVILQVAENSYAHRYARVLGLPCSTGRLELPADARRSIVSGDWVYRLTKEGNSALREYRGDHELLDVPAQVDGHRVIRIDPWCFDSNQHLTEVTLPRGLTSIGQEAFGRCVNLRSVTMPDSVTWLGKGVFANCIRLEEVRLSCAIRRLPPLCFARCLRLREIDLPAELEEIGEGALYACIRLLTLFIPHGVRKIGSAACGCCEELRFLALNEGLSDVARDAFRGCGELRLPELPASLTEDSRQAFRRCLGAEDLEWPEEDEDDEDGEGRED